MNKNEYKRIMSQIYPSRKVIDEIMDITNKKHNKSILLKRVVAMVLTLAILVGGGIGVNAYFNNKIDHNVLTEYNQLSVMIAYAGDYKTVGKINAGSINEQQIFYSIHFADINDSNAVSMAKQQYDIDYSTVQEKAVILANNGSTASIGSGSSTCWSSVKDEDTAILYKVRGGSFALNLDDYTNVRSITFENSSVYGSLALDCFKNKDDIEKDVITYNDLAHSLNGCSKHVLSGDELIAGQKSGLYEVGISNVINKGYYLNWEPSDELYQSIGNDLNFDLSQIKDTITFTVEYNDGSIQTASLNLYFDSNGYMHFE